MLSGLRVLVVEDEPLVAEHIRDILMEAEAEVVGPLATVREARRFLKDGQPVDAALLDVALSDGEVTPVLESLRAQAIPTVVYTGAAVPEGVRRRHPEITVLQKPVLPAGLIGALKRATRAELG
jgi:DNA-binding NtrC family response regulator